MSEAANDPLTELDAAAERLTEAIRACLAAGHSLNDITAESGLDASDILRLVGEDVSDRT